MMGLGYASEIEQGGTYSHATAAHVVVAADKGTDILGEGTAIDIFGYLDHFQVGVGNTFALSLGEGQEQEDDVVLLAGVETPNHTKVHEGQASIITEQDVAWMGITVEGTIDNDLLEI